LLCLEFPDVLTPDALSYVIQAIANPVLLSDPQQQEAEGGEGEAPGRVTAASKRNQALVRLFNILRECSLGDFLRALNRAELACFLYRTYGLKLSIAGSV
jgi:hypothetical protein